MRDYVASFVDGKTNTEERSQEQIHEREKGASAAFAVLDLLN